LIYFLIIWISRTKSVIFVKWDNDHSVLVRSHVKILQYFVYVVSLIQMQSSSFVIVCDLNVKNFLCFFQVLNFENMHKSSLESVNIWQICKDCNNVIYIEKQHDFFDAVKKKTQISVALMKIQFDQFDNTLLISVLCDLLKIIETVQYAQNTIRCDVDFRKRCYVDCFLQKKFCENIVDIHWMTF